MLQTLKLQQIEALKNRIQNLDAKVAHCWNIGMDIDSVMREAVETREKLNQLELSYYANMALA